MQTILWTLAGCASTFLGLIGLILPIVPGVLFLILAAICFQRAGRASTLDQRQQHLRAPRLDCFERSSPRPALNSVERVQLQFWLFAQRLLRVCGGQPRTSVRPAARG